MPFVERSNNYATGIPRIDKDHRSLFMLINNLHDKAAQGFPDESVKATIDALVDYVEYHFTNEEDIMDRCGYDDIESHKAGHRNLQRLLESYRLSYLDDPKLFDVAGFVEFLKQWLQSHILTSDMAYIPYVQGLIEPDDK